MAARVINRLGQRFNRLVVVGRAPNRFDTRGVSVVYWECLCDCGKTKEIAAANLDRTQSCGCAYFNNPKKILLPGIVLRNGVLADYKKRAKQRDLDWMLSDNQVLILLQENCHYCGVVPNTILTTPPSYGGPRCTFVYNGIDRKDSKQGYIPENCVSCCKTCNYAKRDLEYSQFLDYLQRVTDFRSKK